MVFGVSTEEPGLEIEPGLTCVTERVEGPSGSESLTRTPGGLEEMELSSVTELVSAMACGGVLLMVVSIVSVSELSASELSLLRLPAMSVKELLPTKMTPSEVLSVSGVKFAV